MKKYLLWLILFSFISTHLTAQQWVVSPASANLLPDNYTIFGIKVVDKNVIWATASNGSSNISPTHLIKILRSVNGGETWKVFDITAAQGRVSYDIQAIDSSTAWITTNSLGADTINGRGIFKTSNGGQTWRNTLNHRSGGVYVRFFDKNNGIAINRRYLSYTTDGGEQWVKDSTPLFNAFGANEFTGLVNGTNACIAKGDTIWIGTSVGRIMRTTNKGRDWTAFSTGIPPSWSITTVAFSDAQNGMLVGVDKDTYLYTGILKTNNGGETWQIVPQSVLSTSFNINTNITAIPNKNQKTYLFGLENLASTKGASLLTIDDGKSWFGLEKDIHSHGASEFISPQIGWIGNGFVKNATNPVTMFKWQEDGVLSPTTELYDNVFFSISPNPIQDILNLQFEDALNVESFDARILDVGGKVVFQNKTNDKQLIIKHLQSGIYFLTVKTKDKMGVVKFVKN
jgi:photosystem II stability/assembly factor-like uncharacterized protein